MADEFKIQSLEKTIADLRIQLAQCRVREAAAAEGEHFYRNMFDNANIGMCIIDTEGRFRQVNKKICRLLEFTSEELVAMTVNDVTHPEDVNISPTIIRRAVSGEVIHSEFEKRYVTKSGNMIWGQVTSSLVQDENGAPLFFVSQLKEITKRKMAEKQLLETSKQLEQLVRERTADLVRVNEQLENEIK